MNVRLQIAPTNLISTTVMLFRRLFCVTCKIIKMTNNFLKLIFFFRDALAQKSDKLDTIQLIFSNKNTNEYHK